MIEIKMIARPDRKDSAAASEILALNLNMQVSKKSIIVELPFTRGIFQVPRILRTGADFFVEFSTSIAPQKAIVLCNKKGKILRSSLVSVVGGIRTDKFWMNIPVVSVAYIPTGKYHEVCIRKHQVIRISEGEKFILKEKELWSGIVRPQIFACRCCGQTFDHFPDAHRFPGRKTFCVGIPVISKMNLPERFSDLQKATIWARQTALSGQGF